MPFKEALKSAMKQKGLTATDLSKVLGVSKSTVSQWLSGKHEPPKHKQITIAEDIGLPADFFVGEGEPVGERVTFPTVQNLPVQTAAKLMGKSKEFLYKGLQDGRFPFGYAVKMGNQWSYYISPKSFTQFTGIEVGL